MNRDQFITARLAERSSEIVQVVLDLPLVEWEATPEDVTRMHRPFGFMPFFTTAPAEDSLGPTELRFVFCSELILKQTTALDDDDLTDYLDSILFHVLMHYNHEDDYTDPYELERFVESAMYDVGPVCAAMVARVQMEALA